MAAASGAFQGEAKIKDALVASALAPLAMGSIWWPVAEKRDEVETFCEANGLAPAFFHFTRAIAAPTSEGETGACLSEVLSKVPLKADTGAIVRRWCLWLWDGRGTESLKDLLEDSDALAPASELVALLRSGADQTPSRQQWRQLRNRLFTVEGLDVAQRGAANIVAAMGWDFTSTPGAAGDLVYTCFSEASAVLNERTGWTDEDGAAVAAAITRQYNLAMAELGEAPADRSDREAMGAYTTKMLAIAARVATDDEKRAMARHESHGVVLREMSMRLRSALRAGFLDAIEPAPDPMQASA